MLNVECRMMNAESQTDEFVSHSATQHSAFNIQLFYYDQEAFHLIYMYAISSSNFHQLWR